MTIHKDNLDKKIKQMMKGDLLFMNEWDGTAYDKKDITSIIEHNIDAFRIHLDKHGEISEFKYAIVQG